MDVDDGRTPAGDSAVSADLQQAPDLIDVTGGVEPAEGAASVSLSAAGPPASFEDPVLYDRLASPASVAASAPASVRYSLDEHSPDAQGVRRHSQRSVKRRRFDDELVESSLVRHHDREKAGGGSTIRHRSLHVGNGDSCGGAGGGLAESPGGGLASPIISDSHAASSVSALHLTSPTAPVAPTRQRSLSVDVDVVDSSTMALVASALAATTAAAVINPALASTAAAGAATTAPKRKSSAKSNADTRSRMNKRKSLPKHDSSPVVIAAIDDTAVDAVARDQERWKAQDDFLLIQAIQQLSDLAAVHMCVKFSCSFSLRDIQERWYALLYDKAISKRARNCIRQLPADVLTNLRRRAPFSAEEEAALGALPSGSTASTEAFEDLLREHATAFSTARTARCLRRHWLLLRHYRLLPDQVVSRTPAVQTELQQYPVVAATTISGPAVTTAAASTTSAAASTADLHRSGGDAAAGVSAASADQLQLKNCSEYQFSFSDAEEAALMEADASGPGCGSAVDAVSGSAAPSSDQEKRLSQISVKYELALADRRQKREIRRLEADVRNLRTAISSLIEEAANKDFDSQTLAVLRGQLVRYLMRSRKVTFGRVTADNVVDIDLSLEGPSHKVSRQQGSIQLLADGEFLIENKGQRPLYVDGRPVTTGTFHRLTNNSVVEVCTMRFVFFTNPALVQSERSQSGKITESSGSLLPAGIPGPTSEAA